MNTRFWSIFSRPTCLFLMLFFCITAPGSGAENVKGDEDETGIQGVPAKTPFRFTFYAALTDARLFRQKSDSRKRSPVFHPVLNDPLLVRALLAAGAEVNHVIPRQDADETYYAREAETASSSLEYAGTAEVARLLLAAGADVNQENDDGRTPLFYVTHVEVAKLFIAHGADVHHRDSYGMTPIFHAAAYSDVLEVLLVAGAKADTHPSGLSPLHYTLDAKGVRLLVAAGADVNAHGKHVPMTPLFVFGEGVGKTAALLEAGADAKFRMQDGRTVLHIPATAEIVRLLLAAGADPNVPAGEYRMTPLMLVTPGVFVMEGEGWMPYFSGMSAVEYLKSEEIMMLLGYDADEDFDAYTQLLSVRLNRRERDEMISAMIAAGADVNLQNYFGACVLHLATDAEMTKTFLDAGANIHALTLAGRSALHYAQDLESLKLLVEAGADVSLKDAKGETPLFFAKDAPSAAWLIEKMREAGQDPKVFLNELSKNERTVLHALCRRGMEMTDNGWGDSMEDWMEFTLQLSEPEKAACRQRFSGFFMKAMLLVLLEAGADLNARDGKGNTLAFRIQRLETFALLKKCGADFSVMNHIEETLLTSGACVVEKTPDVVRFLIDEGVDVHQMSNTGRTPLTSSRICAPESVKILLDAGADPNFMVQGTRFTDFPLQLHEDSESVRFLIEAGADVNVCGEGGRTALHSETCPEEKARLLIAASADVDVRDSQDQTPLFLAAKNPAVMKLLLEAGADVNAKDKDGQTVLAAKIEELGLPKVEMLLEAGAVIDTLPSGETLLHKNPKPEVAELLIGMGLDVHARDNQGRTPLFLAKNDRLAKVFLDAGADVNAQANDGKTPIFECPDGIISLLLLAGAKVDMKDNRGDLPIHFRRDFEIRRLLEAGADVNAKNHQGATALHTAVDYHRDLDVLVLLEGGADANARDADGNTPLYGTSCYDSETTIADLLRKHGANVNVKNTQHQTPLHFFAYDHMGTRWLLEQGADPNTVDINGETPLFNVENRLVYQLFLKAGANPHIRNLAGELALCVLRFGVDGMAYDEDDDGSDDDDDEISAEDEEEEDVDGRADYLVEAENLGAKPLGCWETMCERMYEEELKRGVSNWLDRADEKLFGKP